MKKNDNIVIKDATIAKFTRNACGYGVVEDATHYSIMRVEFENIKTSTCVVFSEDHKAVDIETGEVFPIIRKDKNNRILNDESDAIFSGEPCILYLREKEWDKISLLYQMVIKNRAKDMYERYNNAKLENQEYNGKVMKLVKRDGN